MHLARFFLQHARNSNRITNPIHCSKCIQASISRYLSDDECWCSRHRIDYYPRFENYSNFWLVKTPGKQKPYSRVLLGHIVTHWLSLCHSQFYVLYWHFSSLLYRFFVWCLLNCHNDVIDAGHNNRLFAPGTDMDRERLRLSHLQNVGLVKWYENLFTLEIVIFPSGVVLGKYDLSRMNKYSYSIL
jgi:hypothetical protein